nr:hypothetical protein [Tanacetum cinerariifolium]
MPSAPIIEDWVFDLEYDSEGEPMSTQKALSFVQTFEHVKSLRLSVKLVENPIIADNLKTDISKSKGHGNSRNRKAAVGPSNTVVSPTLRKSSYVDPSQYLDDPNMLALEEITYSDDEEDVGAEADFSNLETNITVSPILTTRVHKDHHVTQIIDDLSSVPQIRSMTRMVKEQAEILRKLGLTDGKLAGTPIDTEKPLLKDPDGEDVDVHTYMSMIGSLMYLTSSRPDIRFYVYACACFQVTPKALHLHAVKRIFSIKLLKRTLHVTNVSSAG